MALALSIPAGEQASDLVAITFIVVALSSAIQGMTLNRVIPRQIEADKEDPSLIVGDPHDFEEENKTSSPSVVQSRLS